MEEYFYFTIHFKSTGETRFLGDVAMDWWESWEEAVEFSNKEPNMPLKYQRRISGDNLIENISSNTTIQLNNTGYEQYFIEASASVEGNATV